MKLLNAIEKSAKLLGACEKADNIVDYKDMVDRMFSTQGATFVTENAYPTLRGLVTLKPHLNDNRVYINAGEVEISGVDNVCIAGNTNAKISFNGGNLIHKVIVYYGARCSIEATNRAVVRIYNICAGEIKKQSDMKSIILKERKFENKK